MISQLDNHTTRRQNSQISEIMEKIYEFSENVNDQSADAAVGKGLGIILSINYYFTFSLYAALASANALCSLRLWSSVVNRKVDEYCPIITVFTRRERFVRKVRCQLG